MKGSRQAVADYVNKNNALNVTNSDIILTSGCTVSLEICFRALAEPGENILVPKPCWNYSTWLNGSGIEAKYYNLDPHDAWNVDISHLESLIDSDTRAILLNTPGNPCGNVFSREHILDILELANRHKLPIISDEVYEFFTFPGVKFHSIASLSEHVPVLTCSGLSKRQDWHVWMQESNKQNFDCFTDFLCQAYGWDGLWLMIAMEFSRM